MRPFPTARITGHATDRWRSRVDRTASAAEARLAIGRLIASGRSRPTSRSWMRDTRPGPGVRFVYSAAYPGVCAIVKDGAVLTIVTRGLCRGGPRIVEAPRPRPRSPRLKPVPSLAWDAGFEEAA